MLLKSIKMQISQLFHKKTTLCIYFLLFGAVLWNFFENMHQFHNGDVTQMMNPLKLSSLSTWSAVMYYMMQFYPLLLVIPTASTYYDDKNSKILNYIQSRVGIRNYLIGKAVSIFFITVILFTVPFITEIIAYSITVPSLAQGDPSNFQYFQTIENDNTLFLSKLYYFNDYIYTILSIIIFGIVTGIFAVFNFFLTTIKIFKFRVFVYFPIYILFYLINIIGHFINYKYETNYFLILPLFAVPENANYGNYFIFCICLLIISTAILILKIRESDIV